MRTCKLLRGEMIMMTIIVSSFLVASIAVGSPIEWSFERVAQTIEWQLAANENFEDVRLTISSHEHSANDIFARQSWSQGEVWRVTTRAPRERGALRLHFDATLGGSEWSASVDVPVDGSPSNRVVDFELTDWEFGEEEQRRVRFRADQSIASVELSVRDVDGVQRTEHPSMDSLGAVREYELTWPSRGGSDVLMFSLTVVGVDGSSRQYHYVPWSLGGEVQHLNFAFNSAVIAEEDRERLTLEAQRIRDAIEQVGQWVELELYVAGYTDTVGSSSSNRELSRRRAASIAEFFAEQGVSIPLLVQGFGEEVLAVETPDGTRADANRRAVFVLRAGAPPQASQFPRSSWDSFEPGTVVR